MQLEKYVLIYKKKKKKILAVLNPCNTERLTYVQDNIGVRESILQ